jgi:hypothetical protein
MAIRDGYMRPKSRNEIVDELIINPRRLAIAHVVLALASAIVVFTLPNTFTPHLPGRVGVGSPPSIGIVIDSGPAWIPYVISWLFSRWLLSGRDQKATAIFIVGGSGIALASAFLYMNLLNLGIGLNRIIVAGTVTLALVVVAGTCSLIWPADAK